MASVLRRGSIGPEVRGVQLRLNTRLKPSPRLKVDGHFGSRTEQAVIRFQRDSRMKPDGIVGPITRAALSAPAPGPTPDHMAKFVVQLGVVDDFVRHIANLEASRGSTSEVLEALDGFYGTTNGRRYLLVKGDPVGVVDFTHFFAATRESYHSGMSAPFNLGGAPGNAVLLGVGLELGQCLAEVATLEMNSCFSREDLGSNRLGAGFGEYVKVRESEASKLKLSQHLRDYLNKFEPVATDRVDTIKTAGAWDRALEALAAIMAGIGDFIVPRAY